MPDFHNLDGGGPFVILTRVRGGTRSVWRGHRHDGQTVHRRRRWGSLCASIALRRSLARERVWAWAGAPRQQGQVATETRAGS